MTTGTEQTQPFWRYQDLVDDWTAFSDSIHQPLPTTIWANPLKTTPAGLQAHMADLPLAPISWLPGTFTLPPTVRPGLRWEYLAGLYHVQEAVSILPALLLDAQPGERVLDLCAAPGNKTAQLAVAMQNRGTLVANDRSIGRMRATRQTFNRLGLLNLTVTVADAANYPPAAGLFDRVLADVPCTCEGTCRKAPHVMRRITVKNSKKMARVQKAILRKAFQLCKPGGRIVYATCTFAPEENELVVAELLDRVGNQVQILPAQWPGLVGSPGLTEWNGRSLPPSLQNCLRIWPHQNDTGGFFIAMLQKRPSATMLPTPDTTPLTTTGADWLAIPQQRFGIPDTAFANLMPFQIGRRKLYLVNRDHRPPAKPQPDSVGMQVMHVDGKYPKLTTGAAMLLGQAAQQNRVQLTTAQMQAFHKRQDIRITAAQAAGCTGTGYLLLFYEGVPLGVGVYRPYRDNLVESLFPKSWIRGSRASATSAR